MAENLPCSVMLIPTGVLLCLAGELQRQKEQIEYLEQRIVQITVRQDEDCERLAREIAFDRQRLAKIEKPPDPTLSQKDRGEILRALLAANSGKMPEKEARQKMHLSKAQFSQLLGSLDGIIEQKPYRLDRRQRILILK